MARTVAIGKQDFSSVIENDYFYVDKTGFIKEWWENGDDVTLITRPRRFGKTLTMSMVDQFFSIEHADKKGLFKGLAIWKEEKYKKLQGIYPVIFFSFANVKEDNFADCYTRIVQELSSIYNRHISLLDSDALTDMDREFFREVKENMRAVTAKIALNRLSEFLYKHYGKKVIILLDEYDTPMQEAYLNGFWNELSSFTRSLFQSTFKTNPYLERAILTGITRVGRESIFSDLNNLEVVTTTSRKYEGCFGFTEEEVFAALEEFGLSGERQRVKGWYDGFQFGNQADIYNPWSILNFLDKKQLSAYWANSSSNSLAGKLVRSGSKELKVNFETLLQGGAITVEIDEQIIYDQLDDDEQAVWSLLLAGGYLKVVDFQSYLTEFGEWKEEYQLELTNFEVKMMFRNLIKKWFAGASSGYNDFIKALLLGDLSAMNTYMNQVAMNIFSYFDTGKNPSVEEPERFYHGFVLGLIVELSDRYVLTSNKESGFGRYDVMLEPRNAGEDGIILEFKVQERGREKELQDTAKNALDQIEKKKYEAVLVEKGIARERIRKYGFAFCGKNVLIDGR